MGVRFSNNHTHSLINRNSIFKRTQRWYSQQNKLCIEIRQNQQNLLCCRIEQSPDTSTSFTRLILYCAGISVWPALTSADSDQSQQRVYPALSRPDFSQSQPGYVQNSTWTHHEAGWPGRVLQDGFKIIISQLFLSTYDTEK